MKKCFTLIELLVVILIIAILAAMLLPALQKAKARSLLSHCKSNMKQIAAAASHYATENEAQLPGRRPWGGTTVAGVAGSSPGNVMWDELLAQQAGDAALSNVLMMQGMTTTSAPNGAAYLPANVALPYSKDREIFSCPTDRAIVADVNVAAKRSFRLNLFNGTGETSNTASAMIDSDKVPSILTSVIQEPAGTVFLLEWQGNKQQVFGDSTFLGGAGGTTAANVQANMGTIISTGNVSATNGAAGSAGSGLCNTANYRYTTIKCDWGWAGGGYDSNASSTPMHGTPKAPWGNLLFHDGHVEAGDLSEMEAGGAWTQFKYTR